MSANARRLRVSKAKPAPDSARRAWSWNSGVSPGEEQVQTLREEMQTSQEELKSTNEELQSTNEELQSTNEELTTSKEEMQSLNEELQTVNAELQAKVDELSGTNNDMKNLLNSTDIATVFLDNALHVRRFTSQAKTIIKLISTDVGRPITDLASDLLYPELVEDAARCCARWFSAERAIATGTAAGSPCASCPTAPWTTASTASSSPLPTSPPPRKWKPNCVSSTVT
jgi:seryl-tRNA synthetase